MTRKNLKFGIFLSSFQSLKIDSAQTLSRDLQLICHLDNLGYDYVWIDEHYSENTAISESPDFFIAQASEHTQKIKFGVGISSLCFHNPLTLANRILQLYNSTGGRVALCMNPQTLTSDAAPIGLNVSLQKAKEQEAIDILIALLQGERVNRRTDWFELVDAQLHFQDCQMNPIEMAVTSQVSPSGMITAGKHGIGVISVGATTPGGFNALAANREIYERKAAENSKPTFCEDWSLVGPMHIAETKEDAIKDVRFGITEWVDYFKRVKGIFLVPDGSDPIATLVENGLAVIGTPDDAIAQIRRLERESGGFGTFLQLAHNWADWEKTKKSYALFAKFVVPLFQAKA